jgi:hypothetical protein
MEEATQEKIEGKPQTPYWELWEKHLDLYKSKEPERFSSIKPAKEREVKKAMETRWFCGFRLGCYSPVDISGRC